MIKAVFFDFYNTLVRFWPPVEEIQVGACRDMGLVVTAERVRAGYALADVYFNRENARSTLARRSEAQRDEFFARYEQIILQGAGMDVDLTLALRVWKLTTLVPKRFTRFEDTVPALRQLKDAGYALGLLSNLDREMGPLVEELGLAPYLDICITAREVGAEKPHPAIFLAALDRLRLECHEAAHVGDQYHSDVEGARGVGMTPVLLDRQNRHADITDCLRVTSLSQVEAALKGAIPHGG